MTPLRVENGTPEEYANWRAPQSAEGELKRTPEMDEKLELIMTIWRGLPAGDREVFIESLKLDDVTFARWAQATALALKKRKPLDADRIDAKSSNYRTLRQALMPLIQKNPRIIEVLSQQIPLEPKATATPKIDAAPTPENEATTTPTEEEMPADLERLGFESIDVKGEAIYFKTIRGRHSWNSGLAAAGNELKNDVELGLKIKYPDKLQALRLLEKAKSSLPANTSVGTFIDEPGGYMILHGDKPSTRTTDTDRSPEYPHTEMMVFVVPDDDKMNRKKEVA